LDIIPNSVGCTQPALFFHPVTSVFLFRTTKKDRYDRSFFTSDFSVLLSEIVAFVEAINASTCIDKFLFAGIERVAFGTNFHANIFASRTGMDYLAACARDRCVNVLGMNAFLQLMSPLLL
jgi:hypothetical protein